MKRPRVSVIMPAYNAENVVKESIDSILSQTFKDFELIIIDDCSKDRTKDIVGRYAKRDNRIKAYTNKKNLGIGANRTKGIKLASGEYICWQDADDVSQPDRIETQVRFLDNHPKVGVAGGFIRFFDEHAESSVRTYAENDKSLREKIFRYNPVAQPASMFRRICYEKVGYYDEKYKVASEDLEMLFRIGTQFEFGNVQQIVLNYRQSDSSLTKSNLKRMEIATLKLRWRYARNEAYRFNFIDLLFNIAQFLTLMIMPVKLRMKVFQFIRGDK